MKCRRNLFGVFFLSLLGLICTPLWAEGDFSALKKFLAARMYIEAYDELMRCELRIDKEDPKLTKLKKDILANTRKDALSRSQVRPDDVTILTILADLDFQENQVDSGIQKISKATEKSPTALTYYVLAKLLFAKGEYGQSHEAMQKAFEADPGSEAILADFQFLYNCKNYGLATGKKISQNSEFIRRSFQVAANKPAQTSQEAPFENDPTKPPKTVLPPEPDAPEPDPLITAKPPDAPTPKPTGKPPKATPSPTPKPTVKPTEEPIEPPLNPDDLGSGSEVTPPKVILSPDTPKTPDEADDPEKKKMADAERLLKEAEKKLEEKDFENSRLLLKKAQNTYPGIPGVKELEEKIKKTVDSSQKVEDEYLTSVKLFEKDQFDLALKGIQKSFENNPKKHPEAPFYLGKIYVFGTKKDLKKARFYFDQCLKDPDAPSDMKRDIEWIIIGLLTDNEEYAEAYEKFSDFEVRERDYARSRNSYWELKYLLWYKNYSTEVHIGIGIFALMFFLVFLLRLAPSLGIFIRDPLKRAKTAMQAKQFDKAIKVAEDALLRGTQPPPIQRQLLEICVELHYNLKNYFKCSDHAKQLLHLFPDNQPAFKFLTLSFLETKATHDEAIAMYEEAYRREPSNKVYLPFLAKHYISQKQFTVESLGIMYDYFQADRGNRENVLALAEAFVETKRMSDDSIIVLEEALKDKPDQLAFRELLARNYARTGKFSEATRECLKVLQADINNMGIHVVYTSCMKKLNMTEEAILQYEEFSKKHPGNAQVTEILRGMRKEVEATVPAPTISKSEDELTPFTDDLVMDELKSTPGAESIPAPDATDIDSFVEPPPEGFDANAGDIPVPDFLKKTVPGTGGGEALPVTEAIDVPTPFDTQDKWAETIPDANPDDALKNLLSETGPVTDLPAENEDALSKFISGEDEVAQKLVPEPQATKPFVPIKTSVPTPKPQPSKEPKPLPKPTKKAVTKARTALEDFITQDESISNDLLGADEDDLTKDILGDEGDLTDDLLPPAKPKLPGKPLPKGPSPKGEAPTSPAAGKPKKPAAPDADDLGDLTTLDPFADENAAAMDGDLSSLLSGKKKPVAPKSPSSAGAKKPPTISGAKAYTGEEDDLEGLLKPRTPKAKAPAPTASGKPTPGASTPGATAPGATAPKATPPGASASKPKPPASGVPSAVGELAQAQAKAGQKKWEEVVTILTPYFAGTRNPAAGVLLANAHLQQKKPDLAKEILSTLEFDREMLSDDIKDVLYRVGLALEEGGKIDDALRLYDIICNVDINFRDVFDRSDRLYQTKKRE